MTRRIGSGGVLIVAVLGTALLELAINPHLFMTPGLDAAIDPWVYTGFFLSLPYFIQLYPDTYYGSRLSVVLPGFVAHRMLPPLVANYALHLTLFLALLLATYGLVRSGVNRFAAVLATLVMAWHPIVLSALSWDYVDGFGIVFFVAALWCLEQSARARTGWRWGSVATGIAIACMVTANLFLVTMVVVLGVFFHLRAGVDHRHRTLAVMSLAGVGALVTCAGFGAASVGLGNTFWYLGPQLRVAQSLTAARNPWQFNDYQWLTRATWLVLPASAAIGAIVTCVRWMRADAALTFQVTIQFVFLLAVSLWVTIQALSTPVLQVSYYSSYLAPLALLALSLQGALPDANPRLPVLVATATATIFAAGHWVILSDVDRFWRFVEPEWIRRALSGVPWIGPAHQQNCFAATCALVAGVMAVAALNSRGPALRRWLVFAVCLTLSFAAVPQAWPSPRDGTTGRYELTIAAHRFIAEHIDGRKLRFWYNFQPETMSPARSIASTYLWGYVLVNEELPVLTAVQASTLTAGTRLVLLVPTVADAESVRAPLRRFGFDYRIVKYRQLNRGALSVSVVMCDLISSGHAVSN